ncbi:retrovirus-related pol polyprotein from transposon TNT 1-94 [Tanacetum coccineum]
MKMFLAMVERQFNKRVKIVRSDNGTEFTCTRQFFLDEGIIFQTSSLGTPQQNGRVERKHRHILNVARALRFQRSLPIDFLGECVLTAAYLINRTPSSILNEKTPYEILYNVEPPYSHMRIFGCLCYAHIKTRDKFASRSRKCVFVVYPYGQKEPIVPSVNDNEYNDTEIHEEPPSQDRVRDDDELVNEDTTVHHNQTVRDDDTLSSPQSLNVEEQIQEENLWIGYQREPVTYYEAIKDKRWRSTMDSELEALERNQTWTTEELTSNKKALGCKWEYKIKYKSDGTIERFKARLVILGNHQVKGKREVMFGKTSAVCCKL